MKSVILLIAIAAPVTAVWAQNGWGVGGRPHPAFVVSLDIKHADTQVGRVKSGSAPSLLVRPNQAGCAAGQSGDASAGTARQDNGICATPFPDGGGIGRGGNP